MSLLIEKVYSDLVASDGTVCVIYLASMNLGRLSHRYAGVQLFLPDGRRLCERTTATTDAWLCRPSREEIEIQLELDSGLLALRYRVEIGDWQPPGEPPRKGLDWSVLMARGTGTLTWRDGSRKLEGSGYVDRVRLDTAPRLLGIRQLDWGRIHLSQSTIVYTDLEFRDRSRWTWSACWPHGDGSPVVQPHLPNADLRLDAVRDLHCGPAMHAAPDPSLTERLVSRLLVGPAYDQRRLSRATSGEALAPATGWAVHETVRRTPV